MMMIIIILWLFNVECMIQMADLFVIRKKDILLEFPLSIYYWTAVPYVLQFLCYKNNTASHTKATRYSAHVIILVERTMLYCQI